MLSGILIHLAIWPKEIWAENCGGCAPLGEGEMGIHLTQCGQGRGLPACQLPSFILIHPTVWPQYTNVADRQDRQRSDSVGRTVLQTVAQKLFHQQT